MSMFSTFNGICGGGLFAALANRSLSFNGSNDLSLSNTLWGTYDPKKFAIDLWFKPTTVPSGGDPDVYLYSRYDTTTNKEFRVFMESPGILVFSVRIGVDSFTAETPISSITVGAWNHILAVFDSAQASNNDRLYQYFNGNRYNTSGSIIQNSTVTLSSLSTYIGSNNGSGNNYNGLIYQPIFFSGTIPSIGQVYNAGSPVNVVGLPGAYSLLNTNTSDPLEYDFYKTLSWTNDGGVTKSTTVPT